MTPKQKKAFEKKHEAIHKDIYGKGDYAGSGRNFEVRCKCGALLNTYNVGNGAGSRWAYHYARFDFEHHVEEELKKILKVEEEDRVAGKRLKRRDTDTRVQIVNRDHGHQCSLFEEV